MRTICLQLPDELVSSANTSGSGSARASRAGGGALAIANFDPGLPLFGEGAENGTRGACAPQSAAYLK